jgi:putative NADH-flavin reductase
MGAPFVLALLESGFDVVAITRLQSTATFQTRVTVKKVDTTSTAALTEPLKGQDAVVSTVGTAAASVQKTLIDAAVAAHVKRFIPSEFGYNTREARGTKVGGLLKAKIETVAYLIELSKKHDWFT